MMVQNIEHCMGFSPESRQNEKMNGVPKATVNSHGT